MSTNARLDAEISANRSAARYRLQHFQYGSSSEFFTIDFVQLLWYMIHVIRLDIIKLMLETSQ